MKLKDLYSFRIVRATQQKDRREELETLKRADLLLYEEGVDLVRASWLADDMYSGICSYVGRQYVRGWNPVAEYKAEILSELDKFKRTLLTAKDLIERIPPEEEVDEFTKIVNEVKTEIKNGIEDGLIILDAAINVCRDIDLSSIQTCKETSRKCYKLLEEAREKIGPTTMLMYTLIGYLETGVIP